MMKNLGYALFVATAINLQPCHSTGLDNPLDGNSSKSVMGKASASLSILIKLDGYPEETGWRLRDIDAKQVVAEARPGTYTVESATILQHIDVLPGVNYRFVMVDTYGDGMDGSFELNLETSNPESSSLIDFVDDFKDHKHRTAFAFNQIDDAPEESEQVPAPTNPPPSVTTNPVQSPINSANDSLWPTHAPTSCKPDGGFDIELDPFTKNPHFASPANVFGRSELLCGQHGNYADCTNEIREDCQWIFLTQGERNGKCRLDPIAKCLETGDCVCNTEDFHGGSGQGILFHAPISITARDIGPFNKQVRYSEVYQFPENQNREHPQDDTYFISKVDFTGRRLQYEFDASNPLIFSALKTISFKVSYLYMDIPLVGTIWKGLGLEVKLDTSGTDHKVGLNGMYYTLPNQLTMWSCNQITVTGDTLYVGATTIPRVLSQESSTSADERELVLGSFSGELFDVRVYEGSLSLREIREVGARCVTNPDDPVALQKRRDISRPREAYGCDMDVDDKYEVEPVGGRQTYGSGPFATLWMRPTEDFDNPGHWKDIPEGSFDEEYYFQHLKLQQYQWERQYFENDMIAFILPPYRSYTVDEVPEFAASFYNNPCRFIHQNNNLDDFPIYDEGLIPKWTVEEHGDSEDSVFDLGYLHKNGGFEGYAWVLHEMFHFHQYYTSSTYGVDTPSWQLESSAEYGPSMLFPYMSDGIIMAAVGLSPAYPMSFDGGILPKKSEKITPTSSPQNLVSRIRFVAAITTERGCFGGSSPSKQAFRK